MRLALVALGFLFAGCDGCGAPAERPDAGARAASSDGVPIVFAWTVSHPRWGEEALLVKADGRTRYLLDAPGDAPIRSELTLSEADVRELRTRLQGAQTCALVSQRAEGHDGESRPSLQLEFPDMHCTVALWWDEWRNRQDAHATSELVLTLRGRLREAAAGLPSPSTP